MEDNVVVIVDYRTEADPNMKILNSYKITNRKQQKESAQIMLDYNNANPVSPAWERTKNSIVKEWRLHNKAYQWLKNSDSELLVNVIDCDFNNGHEG